MDKFKPTQEDIIKYLTEKFGDSVSNFVYSHKILSVETDINNIKNVLGFLKIHPILEFNFLTDLCGIHYPKRSLDLGVIYHLYSFTTGIRMRVKVFFSKKKPNLPSVVSLWNAANWMERETYDFFGIVFENHPNLKRILNVDDMDIFPMRKEYPLEDPNRIDKDDSFFGR